MRAEIKVPKMGESISEAVVGNFLKQSGVAVKVDEEVLELETEKVNQVLYAPAAGVLTWQVEAGATVAIGQLLGYVDAAAATSQASSSTAAPAAPAAPAASTPRIAAAAPSPAPAAAQAAPPPSVPVQPVAAPAPPPTPAPLPMPTPAPVPKPAAAPKPTPAAAAAVTVTVAAPAPQPQPVSKKPPAKPPEKMTEKVPEKAPEKAPDKPAERVSEQTPTPPPLETRRKMSPIRRVIAQRLVEARQQTAMLTTFNEVDMSAIADIRSTHREHFSEHHGIRLGLLSFFVKATVSALRAFPIFNSYIDGDDIVERHDYAIGVAVGADRGLVVPVLRNCDQLSFADIERQLVDYSTRAHSGRLTLEELQGGGFTITNGGVYGSLLATPLLNLPQCGILGIHKIEKRPVVVNDQIVIRPMMYLALSYDHRLADGKEAVLFLVHIKEHLEDPSRLLLQF